MPLQHKGRSGCQHLHTRQFFKVDMMHSFTVVNYKTIFTFAH